MPLQRRESLLLRTPSNEDTKKQYCKPCWRLFEQDLASPLKPPFSIAANTPEPPATTPANSDSETSIYDKDLEMIERIRAHNDDEIIEYYENVDAKERNLMRQKSSRKSVNPLDFGVDNVPTADETKSLPNMRKKSSRELEADDVPSRGKTKSLPNAFWESSIGSLRPRSSVTPTIIRKQAGWGRKSPGVQPGRSYSTPTIYQLRAGISREQTPSSKRRMTIGCETALQVKKCSYAAMETEKKQAKRASVEDGFQKEFLLTYKGPQKYTVIIPTESVSKEKQEEYLPDVKHSYIGNSPVNSQVNSPENSPVNSPVNSPINSPDTERRKEHRATETQIEKQMTYAAITKQSITENPKTFRTIEITIPTDNNDIAVKQCERRRQHQAGRALGNLRGINRSLSINRDTAVINRNSDQSQNSVKSRYLPRTPAAPPDASTFHHIIYDKDNTGETKQNSKLKLNVDDILLTIDTITKAKKLKEITTSVLKRQYECLNKGKKEDKGKKTLDVKAKLQEVWPGKLTVCDPVILYYKKKLPYRFTLKKNLDVCDLDDRQGKSIEISKYIFRKRDQKTMELLEQ